MGKLNLENDSSFCICIRFSTDDKTLRKLNKSLYKEIKQYTKVKYKPKEVAERFIWSRKNIMLDKLKIDVSIMSASIKGFKNMFKGLFELLDESKKESKKDQLELEKEIKAYKIYEKRLLDKFKETTFRLRFLFLNIERVNTESFIESVTELKELKLLDIIENNIKTDFEFSICSKLNLKKENYSPLPNFSYIEKLKSVNQVDKKFGEFSINNIGWSVNNSPLGLTNVSIGSLKEIFRIRLDMEYKTEKIIDLDDKIKTTLRVAKSIIQERNKNE